MTEEQKEEVVVTPENKKNSKEKGIRRFAILLGVLAIIAMIIYGTVFNKEFKIWALGVICIVIIIIVSIVYNFSKLQARLKKIIEKDLDNEKIPKPVSTEVILEKLNNEALKNEQFMNEIAEVLKVVPYNIGGNLIYCFEVKVYYQDPGKSMNRHIIYNACYPNRLPAVLDKPSQHELNKVINGMSSRPHTDPEIEKVSIFSEETGRHYQRETTKPPQKKDEEKKEENELK